MNIPFDPSPSGQGAHHFSRLLHLAVGGVRLGVGWGSGPLGTATRCPPRRRPFHFFFATWPFLAIRNVRVLGSRRTTTDDGRNRAPPRPPFFEKKIAKILSPKFFLAILITLARIITRHAKKGGYVHQRSLGGAARVQGWGQPQLNRPEAPQATEGGTE